MMNIVVKTETMGTAKAKSEISALKETIAAVGKEAKGFAGALGGSFSGWFRGSIGMGAGAGIGAALGNVFTSLISALKNAVVSAIHMADEIGDAADIAGITRGEMFALQKAAALAGVNAAKPQASMSALAARRAEALNNPQLAALFKRYGVSGSMLADGKVNNLEIAQAIAKTLGSEGMQAGDRDDLGKLLGRRPEQMLAVLRRYEAPADGTIEEELKKGDEAAAKYEEALFKLKELAIFGLATLVDFFTTLATNADRGSQILRQMPGFGGYTPGTQPSAMQPASQPITQKAATSTTKQASEPVVPRTVGPEVLKAVKDSSNIAHAAQASRITVDALARIGLYRGGAQNPQLVALQRQISLQQASLRELRSLNNVMLRATTDDFPFGAI